MPSISVIPGLNFPYYPPRPRTGVVITASNYSALVEKESSRYVIQPKLNGDRAELLVKDGRISFANRHGSLYSFAVKNAQDFTALPDLTVLDGEVWQKNFYPFEAVVVGGISFMRECPTVRSAKAKEISNSLGHTWIFDFEGIGWLGMQRRDLPTWEGVVLKQLGSPYLPLASDTQHTVQWVKRKW